MGNFVDYELIAILSLIVNEDANNYYDTKIDAFIKVIRQTHN